MKKLSKKLVALLMVMTMVLAMGVTSYASTNSTYTVKIYLQTAVRDSSGALTSTSNLNSGNPVTVTVDAGKTYKDAIDIACNTSGSAITDAVWTGTTDKYLDSLKVNGVLKENNGTYPSDNMYVGESWMYFNGVPSTIPADIDDYPDVVLSSAVINSDVSFTLSFESMTYTW